MTKAEIINTINYIKENAGALSVKEMYEFYEKFMNGADKYLLGVEFNGNVYGYYAEEINLEFCKCQTTHSEKGNNQYLRFRPQQYGAKKIVETKDVINFGKTEDVYKLYTCNTKKGYNSGYCFEKAVFDYYGMSEEWTQDNLASIYGGDITLNDEEVQMKFVEKGSLATITSTNKIIRRLEKIVEIMEK